ncbi:MAG: glycosyl hydrolase [Kiritimatiellae bacterium]|nr:glycosyl hydrolase [Kiritimatiellia bacterium]
MKQKLVAEFAQPSSTYRGKPFWAWNGKLEESELRRQIRLMRRMGLGGFFMHSRVGLRTPYLSREWFDCVATCVDEAEKMGMEAWLYDEDRWPSGFAGGLVTKKTDYRRRQLVLTTVTAGRNIAGNRSDILAVFSARQNGRDVTDIERIDLNDLTNIGKSEALGKSYYVFKVEVDSPSPLYNGATYVDVLNHEAIRAFLRATHEAYRKRFGRHFGQVIPGIFTDEPNHGAEMTPLGDGLALPWTVKLPGIFRQRYGYDLIPHLMELVFDVAGQSVSRARYHYHDCVTHLFVTAFGRQIGKWCEKYHLGFTGHLLREDTLSSQTSYNGSCMRFYEYMQIPGMDLLTEHYRLLVTAKQVSSAARQFGRKWRIAETYGCTGWDFPFAGHKAQGDLQVALGINLRCQHLAYYTMAGEAKRDYPASISYQSPWWELYPKVEDYFARIHAVMTQGEEVRDLLVIHPIESMWLLCRKDWLADPNVKRYDAMFFKLTQNLLQRQIDFDYGEEEILARHARVVHGQRGVELHVGQARYRAVVVPPLHTMRRSTLALLRQFQAAGGSVVFIGKVSFCVDASPCADVASLARQCQQVGGWGDELAKAVAERCRRITICDGAGQGIQSAWYLLREDETAFYLFICNTGHAPSQWRCDMWKDVMARERRGRYPVVRISGFKDCQGSPEEWDPADGRRYLAKAQRAASGAWEIATSLDELGSRLFVVPKNKSKTAVLLPARSVRAIKRENPLHPRAWSFSLNEPNALVLDRPQYRLAGKAWKQAGDILHVDRTVRSELGIPLRSGSMIQPWARMAEASQPEKKATLELKYAIQVKVIPAGELFLAIEHPERYTIMLNGNSLCTANQLGWWTDRSLRRIPLDAALLRKGVNELRLISDYAETHPGLEIIYLLGSFGVQIRGTQTTLTALPSQLKIGDWCRQGLPFYSGAVSYRCKIKPKIGKTERVFIRVPDWRGVVARISVNGKNAGIIAWAPYEVDITDCLTEAGPSELCLEIFSHRRNSHGPLHHAQKWPLWTGPAEFTSEGNLWHEAYQLVPCGLLAPAVLSVR